MKKNFTKETPELYLELANLLTQSPPNWKLTKSDGMVKHSVDVCWVEFDEDGRFKDHHKIPKLGYSLLMSPFSKYFTWQTTEVTEIISQEGDTIEFKTLNSIYKLEKL